jgi:hypothetical protein
MRNDDNRESNGLDRTIIQGKELENYFALNADLRDFSDSFREEKSDRAVAIIGAAYLDALLEHTLISFMVDDEKEVQKLLQHDGPLGTFGGKITAAYCLGLIGTIIRDDLRLVGKIRNRFAHDLRVSFDDEAIRSWCLSLKWHEISMFAKPPEGATSRDIFQVGVNQLVCHVNGMMTLARQDKRKVSRHSNP